MILYEYTYEREGNDAWLKDHVQLIYNEIGLYLDHKKRWSGWGEPIKENYTLELDENDLDSSQEKLNQYIENNSLFREFPNGTTKGIQITLSEVIRE